MRIRERVAREICLTLEDDPDRMLDCNIWQDSKKETDQPGDFPCWHIYRDDADAAIGEVLKWAEEEADVFTFVGCDPRNFIAALKRAAREERT